MCEDCLVTCTAVKEMAMMMNVPGTLPVFSTRYFAMMLLGPQHCHLETLKKSATPGNEIPTPLSPIICRQDNM